MAAARFAILGGGLTGLVAAHALREAAPQCELALFESQPRLGGALWTEKRGDYLVERGADSFLTDSPEVMALCQRLGLADDLVSVRPECRRALVAHRGQLVPVPEGWSLIAPRGMAAVWRSPLLTLRGKARLAAERFVPSRQDHRPEADEAFESFAIRRIGREAYERIAQPLVSGIYTADPAELSMAAALPRWWELERRFGSLAAGLAAERSDGAAGARYGLFAAPREGLGQIVEKLASHLPPESLRLNTPVTRLARIGQRWSLTLGQRREELFDAVALCVPAPVAARLLRADADALAAELATIAYADSAIVILRYEKAPPPLTRAAGFVVPAIERRQILAASFASAKFPGRAPEGQAVVRVFLGGALDPQAIDRADAELQACAVRELTELTDVSAAPIEAEVVRWRGAMPQYKMGHRARVARIERLVAEIPGLALAGNAYHGVGIGHCIRSGQQAAKQTLESQRFPSPKR